MIVQSHGTDPRVIRTRNLIQDAFRSLAKEKKIEAITVKDISERATVNRATFYAHFEDKNALLEYMISDIFMTFVSNRIKPETELTKETIRDLILSICNYHEKLNDCWKRDYKSISTIAILVETRVQFKLHDIIINMLANNKTYAGSEGQRLELVATMISWSIYGATYHWYTKEKMRDASVFAEEVLPFIMSGVRSVMENKYNSI